MVKGELPPMMDISTADPVSRRPAMCPCAAAFNTARHPSLTKQRVDIGGNHEIQGST